MILPCGLDLLPSNFKQVCLCFNEFLEVFRHFFFCFERIGYFWHAAAVKGQQQSIEKIRSSRPKSF
ncbi:hypothetical protein HYPBUDRAFT_194492 [Hyphopichia burtonii NRRL Y-1933]|uniref:Uncharacterized protein n=1 Tax=Hyphopichia burtonii NRRL Y-1933 TaxID=984485 RepID=A0A1E4RPB1_9ASCO|nr:hypothetical protein HYPBUDRAFT_194492 [Hyphopichia burtonii NRRL Y-1933]ODV69113.1 hypothetical protein HYPBUDRAFT_194492 [Hyphopichia burtonii NRRL Y-1933]